MLTVICNRLKNTQNVAISEDNDFWLISQKSHFPKTNYTFWKSFKASDWDKSMRLFGRWPIGHTLKSKFSQFCNRKFPSILHTSGLSVKIWNLIDTVFMRKTLFPKMVSKAFNHWKLWNYRTGCFVYTVARTNTLTFSFCRPLLKRLRIRSVISVNYHYITVLCPFNLLFASNATILYNTKI